MDNLSIVKYQRDILYYNFFEVYMNFGNKLRELRLEKGVTQKEVAEFLGLTTKAYCFYELEKREPSLRTLAKICEFYDVSADYLIGRSDRY